MLKFVAWIAYGMLTALIAAIGIAMGAFQDLDAARLWSAATGQLSGLDQLYAVFELLLAGAWIVATLAVLAVSRVGSGTNPPARIKALDDRVEPKLTLGSAQDMPLSIDSRGAVAAAALPAAARVIAMPQVVAERTVAARESALTRSGARRGEEMADING
jgi:hypothetical protein